MKILLERKASLVFLIVQFLLSVILCGLAITVGFIPTKYVVMLAVVCLFLLAYQILCQITNNSYMIGRVLCVVFCAFYVFGGYYMYDVSAAVDEIGGAETKVDIISFYVLKDDKAKTIVDAKDYKFGILKVQDRENTDKSIKDAEAKAGKSLDLTEYEDTTTLVDALYAKEVEVIVFNQAFLETVKEHYKTFDADVRELLNNSITSTVEREIADTDVTTKPFNVYISGIDVYGDISQTSRSDVNVIATVNPVSKKILLTSTPRDYYVPLYTKGGESLSGGMSDKLTHAGIYGVDCSINTLEKLYDIDIDYYVRVNFSSVKQIVNLLGGVKVYSDYDFISDWGPDGAGTHYSFKKGYNKVNGKKALAFCRERHHFANGDYQRGRNHQHMIEAILNKAMSPAILPNFSKMLKQSKGMFQTNMSTKKITSICNMQLNDMAQWKIVYANAEGTGAKKTTYSIRSTALYVCEPDMASIEKITRKINKVMKETEADRGSSDDGKSSDTDKSDAKSTQSSEKQQPTLKP